MKAYYNENNAFCAQWLRNLIDAGHIAYGDVDERSIEDVKADDVVGYTQCHFFAGIGGWSYALRLAGWPDDEPAWTGSCPCQPFSSCVKTKGDGFGKEKDLWPVFYRLISFQRPRFVFGEQVVRTYWIDRLYENMESIGYATRACVLPACSVGFDHKRDRFYFACHSNSDGESSMSVNAKMERLSRNSSEPGNVENKDGLPGRMAIMSAYGNAIVPQVGAVFIRAFMETMPSFDLRATMEETRMNRAKANDAPA